MVPVREFQTRDVSIPSPTLPSSPSHCATLAGLRVWENNASTGDGALFFQTGRGRVTPKCVTTTGGEVNPPLYQAMSWHGFSLMVSVKSC